MPEWKKIGMQVVYALLGTDAKKREHEATRQYADHIVSGDDDAAGAAAAEAVRARAEADEIMRIAREERQRGTE